MKELQVYGLAIGADDCDDEGLVIFIIKIQSTNTPFSTPPHHKPKAESSSYTTTATKAETTHQHQAKDQASNSSA